MKYPGTGLLDTIEECVASMKSKPTTVTITFAPGEIPKGFRLTGEYRCPKYHEWYLFYGVACSAVGNYKQSRYFILEKLPQKKRKGRGKK